MKDHLESFVGMITGAITIAVTIGVGAPVITAGFIIIAGKKAISLAKKMEGALHGSKK